MQKSKRGFFSRVVNDKKDPIFPAVSVENKKQRREILIWLVCLLGLFLSQRLKCSVVQVLLVDTEMCK